MDTFNRMFDGKLPKVTTMTDKRKKAVKARVSEHGKEAIMAVFNNVSQSAFLLGHNNQNWSCDFDWIFRPTNFIKILEGNYNGERISKINRIASSENVIQFLLSLQPSEKLPQKKEKNLKQRALLNKYPDPAQFILDYNPDLQFKIVRCKATHSDLAMNSSIPTLGLLASTYGDETPLEWLKSNSAHLMTLQRYLPRLPRSSLMSWQKYLFLSIITLMRLRYAFYCTV